MTTSTTFSERLLRTVLAARLDHALLLPGVAVLDPLHGDHATEVRRVVTTFHQRFYTDGPPRTLMLGINPGRLGAGSTGLCFTDTKRAESDLGITVAGIRTHEPSSDFFYRVVRAAGGAATFYDQCVVQAICPLGFTHPGPQGTPINLNYYDLPALQHAVTPFITAWIGALIATGGLRTDRVVCIGTGKNLAYLKRLNAEHGFFGSIVPLEHPRYVMQYKARSIDLYVDKYIQALHA